MSAVYKLIDFKLGENCPSAEQNMWLMFKVSRSDRLEI